MSSLISVQNLTKRFAHVTAVDRLCLEIEQGEIFGLIGPDGAGKTTAIRLMLGILRFDSGTGRLGPFDLRKQAESVSTLTGYVSQRFSLYGDLTVEENLQLFADLYSVPGPEREPRVRRLMQFSRLDPFRDRLARNLSGGMRQKLALSCALIHTPKILFLDEPTTGVDPLSRRDLWRLLFDLWQEGVTIVVSTPYMDEAERCSRVGFMNHGRLVASGKPDDLRGDFTGSIFELFTTDRHKAARALKELPQVRGVTVFGEGLHVTVTDDSVEPSIRQALSGAHVKIDAMSRVPPTMEDVFFQMQDTGTQQ